MGKMKALMEDENYRNFVVSRLNTTLDRKLSGEDMHLEDVVSVCVCVCVCACVRVCVCVWSVSFSEAFQSSFLLFETRVFHACSGLKRWSGVFFQAVSKPVFKGMLTMVKALIAGLEQTFRDQGMGGMSSAFMILEIIHTHYWEKDIGSSRSDTSNPSLVSFLRAQQVSLLRPNTINELSPKYWRNLTVVLVRTGQFTVRKQGESVVPDSPGASAPHGPGTQGGTGSRSG